MSASRVDCEIEATSGGCGHITSVFRTARLPDPRADPRLPHPQQDPERRPGAVPRHRPPSYSPSKHRHVAAYKPQPPCERGKQRLRIGRPARAWFGQVWSDAFGGDALVAGVADRDPGCRRGRFNWASDAPGWAAMRQELRRSAEGNGTLRRAGRSCPARRGRPPGVHEPDEGRSKREIGPHTDPRVLQAGRSPRVSALLRASQPVHD